MSFLRIRKDRTKYTAPVVKLCVSIAAVLAVKLGESVVNARFDGQYATPARVVFCAVAALCAILCYQALMEIGYVYDNLHPTAAAEVGAEDLSADEVMEVVEAGSDVRVALLVEGEPLVVGVRAKSAAAEDFTRTYFAGAEEFENAAALREKLDSIAKEGKLKVAAVGEVTARKFIRSFRKEKEKNK